MKQSRKMDTLEAMIYTKKQIAELRKKIESEMNPKRLMDLNAKVRKLENRYQKMAKLSSNHKATATIEVIERR